VLAKVGKFLIDMTTHIAPVHNPDVQFTSLFNAGYIRSLSPFFHGTFLESRFHLTSHSQTLHPTQSGRALQRSRVLHVLINTSLTLFSAHPNSYFVALSSRPS